nr:hypothetical protein [Tanacetum cinerariifolium]
MMQAANTFTNFSGTASLTPLLGAFIANSFAGRFWTRTVASIIYQNPDMEVGGGDGCGGGGGGDGGGGG